MICATATQREAVHTAERIGRERSAGGAVAIWWKRTMQFRRASVTNFAVTTRDEKSKSSCSAAQIWNTGGEN